MDHVPRIPMGPELRQSRGVPGDARGDAASGQSGGGRPPVGRSTVPVEAARHQPPGPTRVFTVSGCSQCEVGFGSHACRNGRCSPAGRPPYCLRTIRSCSPIVASTPEPKRFSPSSTSPTPRRPSDWIYSRLRNQRAGPCSLDAALDEGSMKIVNDAVQLPPDAFLWLGQASDGGTAIQ